MFLSVFRNAVAFRRLSSHSRSHAVGLASFLCEAWRRRPQRPQGRAKAARRCQTTSLLRTSPSPWPRSKPPSSQTIPVELETRTKELYPSCLREAARVAHILARARPTRHSARAAPPRASTLCSLCLRMSTLETPMQWHGESSSTSWSAINMKDAASGLTVVVGNIRAHQQRQRTLSTLTHDRAPLCRRVDSCAA